MIDLDLRVQLRDGARQFDLAAQWATGASFVALFGPSGSGKTITLQAMAGLLRPHAGHIRVNGETWFDAAQGIDLPTPQRQVGYLFQHYALFPHLSVRQNITFGLTSWRRRRLTPAAEARVHGLLARFGLAELADSRPARLSGGQQQRVALARALACESRLLLLDEPFAALNPMLRAQMREELATIQREWNIPVVMITHDVEDVLALADVALVYEQGNIVREVDMRTQTATVRQALGMGPGQAENPAQQAARVLLETTPPPG